MASKSSAGVLPSIGSSHPRRSAMPVKIGPAINIAGTPAIRPNRITQPRSAPKSSATAMGPGVGGMKAWAVARPASKGNPNTMGAVFARLARLKMSGAKIISATSKKTGIATISPTIPMVHRPAFMPAFSKNALDRACMPPPACRNTPNMAPKPTTIAIKPRVPPMPFVTVCKAVSGDMPPAMAPSKLTISNAGKACIFRRMINQSSAATDRAVASNTRFCARTSMLKRFALQ